MGRVKFPALFKNMTRKEGIIKRFNQFEKQKFPLAAQDDVVKREYQNYRELCHFCHEQPKSFKVWTEEEIITSRK